MAKGQLSKEIITKKLLEVFDEAFIYDKNIIIPMVENGEEVQIKVALTCSKTNVERPEGSNISAFETVGTTTPKALALKDSPGLQGKDAAPTSEEQTRIKELLEKLGM